MTESLFSKQASALAIQTIEKEIRDANEDIKKATGTLGAIFWLGTSLLVIGLILLFPLVSDMDNPNFPSAWNFMCVWGFCLLLGLSFVIYGSLRQKRTRNRIEKEWAEYLRYLHEELAKHKRNVIS